MMRKSREVRISLGDAIERVRGGVGTRGRVQSERDKVGVGNARVAAPGDDWRRSSERLRGELSKSKSQGTILVAISVDISVAMAISRLDSGGERAAARLADLIIRRGEEAKVRTHRHLYGKRLGAAIAQRAAR